MLKTFTVSEKKGNKTEIGQKLNNLLKNHPAQRTVTTILHRSDQRQIRFYRQNWQIRFSHLRYSLKLAHTTATSLNVIFKEIQRSRKQRVAEKIIILLNMYIPKQRTKKIKPNILLNKSDPRILGTTKQIQDQLKI